MVEAEDRPALVRFNENVLALEQGADKSFGHAMLIDGNDERGIGVGLLAKDDFLVMGMRSHATTRAPPASRSSAATAPSTSSRSAARACC